MIKNGGQVPNKLFSKSNKSFGFPLRLYQQLNHLTFWLLGEARISFFILFMSSSV